MFLLDESEKAEVCTIVHGSCLKYQWIQLVKLKVGQWGLSLLDEHMDALVKIQKIVNHEAEIRKSFKPGSRSLFKVPPMSYPCFHKQCISLWN